AVVAARAGEHGAVLAEHVAERVDDRERRQPRSLRELLDGEPDARLDGALAAEELADRRAGARADAAEPDIPPGRLAGRVAVVRTGPAGRVPGHEVVDDSARDERD